MVKRILDCTASDFKAMSSRDLFESILAAEGRTILAEVVALSPPLISGVSNPEVCAAFGVDMLVLNVYDVQKPIIIGVSTSRGKDVEIIPGIKIEGIGATINDLKRLVGLPVGTKLEPIDPTVKVAGEREAVPPGQAFSIENMKKAMEQGADFIRIMGNPKTGCSWRTIIGAVKLAKKEFGDKIIVAAGKGHGAGVASEMGVRATSPERVKELVKAGVDWVALPVPGTTPGATVEFVRELVEIAHDNNVLTSCDMLTSQEGADIETIRRFAIYSKMTGADIHHIGDAGYSGMTMPENITAFSTAIRGRRHTYRRMAISIAR